MMEPRDLPEKKPGDFLEAAHVNVLSEAARRSGVVLPGAGQAGMKMGGSYHISNIPPVPNETFRVTQSLGNSLYKGHRLWYSQEDEEWKPSLNDWLAGNINDTTNKEWTIDATGINISLAIGSYVNVSYNKQRSAYVPVMTNFREFVLGALLESLQSGSSALAIAYTDWADTVGGGPVAGTIADRFIVYDFFHYHSRIHLSAYTEILAMYYMPFGRYVLINAGPDY